MLYLFGSGSWNNNRKILKVGFTNDIEVRKSQYKLHNPLGEFIKIREGDEELELKLHIRLSEFQVEFLDEWFFNDPEVIDIFDHTEDEIDNWIWKNRFDTLCYPQIPLPGTLKRKILDKLKIKFNNNLIEGEKLV